MRNRACGDVRIRVEESAGGVTVCAIYPEHEDESCDEAGRHNHGDRGRGRREHDRSHDTEVEFMVVVPKGVNIVVPWTCAGQTKRSYSGALPISGTSSGPGSA